MKDKVDKPSYISLIHTYNMCELTVDGIFLLSKNQRKVTLITSTYI